jgi:hypothetical protein
MTHGRGNKSDGKQRCTVKPELTTTVVASRFPLLEHKGTFEQRPPVNNGHNFGVPKLVVVLRFDCICKSCQS